MSPPVGLNHQLSHLDAKLNMRKETDWLARSSLSISLRSRPAPGEVSGKFAICLDFAHTTVMIAFSSLLNTQYVTELGLAEYLSFSISVTGKTNGACLFELGPLDPKFRTGLEQNIGANIKKSNPWSLMVSLEILDVLLQTCRGSSDFTALVRESLRAGGAIQWWRLRLCRLYV